MGKLVVSLDGVVIKEVQITKDKTTLGRRPYNDIIIDNLAVSGEHAVLQMLGADVFIEDLNSTNGTYINGKAIKEAAAGAQRHRRDRQSRDQVPGGRWHRLRSDADHAAGIARCRRTGAPGLQPASTPARSVLRPRSRCSTAPPQGVRCR